MKIQTFYPITLDLEDPDTGERQAIRARVARLTLEQCAAFNRDLYRSANPPSASLIARQPDGPEQARRTLTLEPGRTIEGAFIVPADEVRARRLAEMAPDARAAFEALEDAEASAADRFVRESITAYVSIEPGQLFEDGPDGAPVPIVTGADVVRAFGGRVDVLQACLRSIRNENTLSPSAKKALRSRSDSARISDAPVTVPPGATQAPTVSGAGIAASVVTEDAAHPQPIPCSGSNSPAAPIEGIGR